MGTILGKRSADVVPESMALKIVTKPAGKSPCSAHRKSVQSPMISFTIHGKRPERSPKASSNRADAGSSSLSPSSVESLPLEERPCMTDDYVPTPIKPLTMKQRMIAMNILARDLFIRYLKSGFWLHNLLEEYRESPFSSFYNATFGRSKSRSSFETVTESEHSYVPSVDSEDLSSVRCSEQSKNLSAMFDTQTIQDLTIALAMQSYLESEVYMFMVDEQWSVSLDGVAIVRYHPAWNPFSSLKQEKTNHAERLAKEFLNIIDNMDTGMLEGVVGDEEVLYRLHTSLEANPLTAYSICSPDDSTSVTLSRKTSSDTIITKDKSFRKIYSSPAFDKQKWPSAQPLPSHWLTRLHHGEVISAVVKLPHGLTVYVQVRPVCEIMGFRRVVTVLQPMEEQQPQLAKDLCLLLSKLVR